MRTDKDKYIGYWLRRFLVEYLPTVKNVSVNTIRSYRDAYQQLLPFISKRIKKSVDDIKVTDMSDSIVIEYLYHIEIERGCTIQTRNLRLAAVHIFAKYVGSNAPEYIDWCRTIRNIPKKKYGKPQITYLEKDEMDALLSLPDKKTEQGWRDYVLLLFLYNTGARVEEAASIKIKDLLFPTRKSEIPLCTIVGKGNKMRKVPLWDITVKALHSIVDRRNADENVFLSRMKRPLSRFGIYEMVVRYGLLLENKYPNVKTKRISPHTIRHTTATHLLQAGVDINTIRAWLGHVSVNTTNVYAEVNLEMKAKALETCEIKGAKIEKKLWKDDDIMSFLKKL